MATTSHTPTLLHITEFGNPLLRATAKRLTKKEILSKEIQQLIADMKYTVDTKKYGVGLAAPQVGYGVALALIAIKPSPTKPDRAVFNKIIINPEIVAYTGKKTLLWEGCISMGNDAATIFAKAARNTRINVTYVDEKAQEHTEELSGFVAHVFQHETDHLNGILFVDRVEDTTTYMTAGEYHKMKKASLSKPHA